MPSSRAVRTARRPSCRVAPRPCTMMAQTSEAGVPARTSQAGALPPSTVDQDVLRRKTDAWQDPDRPPRSTSRAAPRKIAAVDGLDFPQDGAFCRRVGNDPADPGMAPAAVEKQTVDALDRGIGRGGKDDLQAAPVADDGQDFLVLPRGPGRG